MRSITRVWYVIIFSSYTVFFHALARARKKHTTISTILSRTYDSFFFPRWLARARATHDIQPLYRTFFSFELITPTTYQFRREILPCCFHASLAGSATHDTQPGRKTECYVKLATNFIYIA